MMRSLAKYGMIVCLAMAAAFSPRLEAQAAVQGAASWESTGQKGNQADLNVQLSKSAGDGDITAMQVDVLLGVTDLDSIENVKFSFGSFSSVKVKEYVYDESMGELTLFLSTNGVSELGLDKETRIGTLTVNAGEDVNVTINRIQIVVDDHLQDLISVHGVGIVLKATKEKDPADTPDNPKEPENPGSSGKPGSRPSWGGSSGSSGGSFGGGSSSIAYSVPVKGAPETSGTWIQDNDKWKFRLSSGSNARNTWIFVKDLWYHIGGTGYMDTGWYLDKDTWYYLAADGHMKTGWIDLNGLWYYLNTETGKMVTGWIVDSSSWYYLMPSGEMATGWQTINGKQYYFNTVVPVPVQVKDPVTGKTETTTAGQRPYGSMYKGEKTPDGSTVNAVGEKQ